MSLYGAVFLGGSLQQFGEAEKLHYLDLDCSYCKTQVLIWTIYNNAHKLCITNTIT